MCKNQTEFTRKLSGSTGCANQKYYKTTAKVASPYFNVRSFRIDQVDIAKELMVSCYFP